MSIEQLKELAHSDLQNKLGTVEFHEVFNEEQIKLVFEIVYEEKCRDIEAFIEKSQEVDLLQSAAAAIKEELASLYEEKGKLLMELEQDGIREVLLITQVERLEKEKKDFQDEAREYLNQTNRQKTEIDTLNMKLSEARKRTEELQPSIGIAKALEAAKAAKERIRITVATKADHTGRFYNAHDAQGNQLSIPHLELGKYIQDPTLEIPSLETITQNDVDNQAQKVADAAKEAERFSTTLPDLGGGQEIPVGAEETVEDAGADAAPATIKARIETLEERMLRVERALNLV